MKRVIPFALEDARFGTWEERLVHARYWRAQFQAMEPHLSDVGSRDIQLYQSMRHWHIDVTDMLSFVNDVLSPHSFGDIVKDDYAALRTMLKQH